MNNKNTYTKEYYYEKLNEINSKMNPHLNDALLSAYGAMLSVGTKSEFPIFFIGSALLSVAQVNYYLFKRIECVDKMYDGGGLTEPIKLRKVIEYKKK